MLGLNIFKMKHEYLIIYHKEDNDGVFSGALAYNYVKEYLKKNDIVLFGTEYNELNKLWASGEVENWEYDNIIMTDISFNDHKAMQYLYSKYDNRFIWIDHHAPVIKESFKYKFDNCLGFRDSSNSAILNMYRYLYDPIGENYINKKIPELLRVLSAWDSFTFTREGYELDFVSKVNIGINYMYNLDIRGVIGLLRNLVVYGEDSDVEANNSYIQSAYSFGDVILTSKQQENERLIQNYGDFNWTVDGREACALFIQGASSSQMFKSIKDKVKNGIIFKRMSDGKWGISLYNTNLDDTFHCGEYLKKNYKGGGHIGAAGCQVTEAKFKRMLKTKTI